MSTQSESSSQTMSCGVNEPSWRTTHCHACGRYDVSFCKAYHSCRTVVRRAFEHACVPRHANNPQQACSPRAKWGSPIGSRNKGCAPRGNPKATQLSNLCNKVFEKSNHDRTNDSCARRVTRYASLLARRRCSCAMRVKETGTCAACAAFSLC